MNCSKIPNTILNLLYTMLLVVMVSGCKQTESGPLPILGNKEIINGDTILHKIPTFSFVDQNGKTISNNTLQPNLYIADFFFMNCPSICPKVKKQMLRVYEKYENNTDIKLVSHTLDPKRDTPEKMHQYATNLGVDHDKWLFLHGAKEDIFDLADDYFVAAVEDPDAPGGFDHSGKIILVDKSGHVRAFAEGTDPDDVTDFLLDIDKLIREYEQ